MYLFDCILDFVYIWRVRQELKFLVCIFYCHFYCISTFFLAVHFFLFWVAFFLILLYLLIWFILNCFIYWFSFKQFNRRRLEHRMWAAIADRTEVCVPFLYGTGMGQPQWKFTKVQFLNTSADATWTHHQ